jgi:large subunit ribosomal protein L17
MRHKKKGRRLGRSASHRKAMLRNLASSLFLTERDETYYEGLTNPDGTTVNPPRFRGRVVTTLQKAKEVRPLVEKCITIAKKAMPHEQAAQEFATDAERNSAAWKQWREGDQWQKWNTAIAPAISARRRAFSLLRDRDAVEILFEEIAPRFEDRPGGYTRVMRLATPRLGDAGTQAILEFVGVHDRVSQTSQQPSFVDDESDTATDVAVTTEEEPVSSVSDTDAEPAENDEVSENAGDDDVSDKEEK